MSLVSGNVAAKTLTVAIATTLPMTIATRPPAISRNADLETDVLFEFCFKGLVFQLGK